MNPPSYGCDLEDGYSCWTSNGWYLSELEVSATELEEETGDPIAMLTGMATFRAAGETGFEDKSWRMFTFALVPFNYGRKWDSTLYYLDLQLTKHRNTKGKHDTDTLAITYLEDVPYA
jgi:hypothetical protein